MFNESHECKSEIMEIDSVYEVQNENKESEVKIKYRINKAVGKEITFLEKWYFNWDTFTMQKNVLGLVSGVCFYPFE